MLLFNILSNTKMYKYVYIYIWLCGRVKCYTAAEAVGLWSLHQKMSDYNIKRKPVGRGAAPIRMVEFLLKLAFCLKNKYHFFFCFPLVADYAQLQLVAPNARDGYYAENPHPCVIPSSKF